MSCDFSKWCDLHRIGDDHRFERMFSDLLRIIHAERAVVVQGLPNQYRIEMVVDSRNCLCGHYHEYKDACNVEKLAQEFIKYWFIDNGCHGHRLSFIKAFYRPPRNEEYLQLISDNISELELKMTMIGLDERDI